MLVAGACEVIQADEPDAERDGEAHENHDQGRQRNERPASPG